MGQDDMHYNVKCFNIIWAVLLWPTNKLCMIMIQPASQIGIGSIQNISSNSFCLKTGTSCWHMEGVQVGQVGSVQRARLVLVVFTDDQC